MLTTLQIRGFRLFDSLSIEGLSRVNLLVGANNAGKSSVLESVEVLAASMVESPASFVPGSLYRIALRRGESILLPSDEPRERFELDPSHLFLRHRLEVGAAFSLSGDKGGQRQHLRCEVVAEGDRPPPVAVGTHDGADADIGGLALRIEGGSSPYLSLTAYNGLPFPSRRTASRHMEWPIPIQYVGTEVLEIFQIGSLWDAVVLTPQEGMVLEALQLIEPTIERLALVNRHVSRSSSGLFVKLAGSDRRLPLGSLGDGLKRLLLLSLHLVRAAGGYLLVDEIDTGLHHSVMTRMWRLVLETARRLDVQVFATTHSLDCVRALAWLCEDSPELAGDIALHRIERDQERTTLYTPDDLIVAARQYMEIR